MNERINGSHSLRRVVPTIGLFALMGIWLSPSMMCQKMKPNQAPPPIPVQGRTVTMEDTLNHPQPISPQEESEASTVPAQSVAQPSGSHMQLVLRMKEDGSTEVLRAVSVPGKYVVSPLRTGTFLYEIKDSNRTVLVDSMIDPFEVRSFAPLDDPTRGHHITRAKSADVLVKVPTTNLALLRRYTFHFYRMKPTASTRIINEASLRMLGQQNQLERVATVRSNIIVPQVREKLKTLAPPR